MYLSARTVEHATICYNDLVSRGDFLPQNLLCKAAARCGNLSVLQYLRSIGCSWDSSTCAYAALYGHLNILQWAHANGCPWDEDTCSRAALTGHMTVLQ
jgi:hypothetical protein